VFVLAGPFPAPYSILIMVCSIGSSFRVAIPAMLQKTPCVAAAPLFLSLPEPHATNPEMPYMLETRPEMCLQWTAKRRQRA
jgi:hypothetical protein